MIYTHKELLNKYKSNYQINKAVKNGELYKIDDLYSDKKNIHYLEILTKKYHNLARNCPCNMLSYYIFEYLSVFICGNCTKNRAVCYAQSTNDVANLRGLFTKNLQLNFLE